MQQTRNENGFYVLTIQDQEDLHNLAEDVITGLRYHRYFYDDDGNYIMHGLSEDERKKIYDKNTEGERTDYLNFRFNEELRNIKFSDALYMPLKTIKEKYLKDVLKKARGILRKDTSDFGCGAIVSDEVPDEYLDDLLALRWRENLKLWTMQWEQQEKNPKFMAEIVNNLIANAVAHGGDWGGPHEVNTEGLKLAILNVKHALGLENFQLEKVRIDGEGGAWRMFQLVSTDGTELEIPDLTHTEMYKASHKEESYGDKA